VYPQIVLCEEMLCAKQWIIGDRARYQALFSNSQAILCNDQYRSASSHIFARLNSWNRLFSSEQKPRWKRELTLMLFP
jgi:hypothetical protein